MEPLEVAEEGQAAIREGGIIIPPRLARGWGFPWLTAVGFGFLTFNSGMALYHSEGDGTAIALVVFSYVNIFLLLCLWSHERGGGPGLDATRIRVLRGTVWLLTTLLTVLFGWKLASAMPFPVAAAVWIMAFATVLGGFYAFFIHTEEVGL